MKDLKIIFKILIMSALLLAINSCQNENQTADLIITDARIWTGNSDQPWAHAMAVLNDTILAVGNNNEILNLKGTNTKVLNLKNLFVVPGFIDSHVHFLARRI